MEINQIIQQKGEVVGYKKNYINRSPITKNVVNYYSSCAKINTMVCVQYYINIY